MSFKMPDGFVNAGKALHRAVIRLSLYPAKANQVILEMASTQVGKAALLMIPKYGKAITLIIEPVRDVHRIALDVHEAIAAGKDPGNLKNHLNRNIQAVHAHLPNLKEAYREWRNAGKPAPVLVPA